MDKMVTSTVDSIENLIERKENIIDIGAGGGWISQEIQERKDTKNLLLDVISLNQTNLPLVIYDGEKIPFSDNEFDTALIICVLHHCKDPIKVLEEAKRVVKNKIIIIENFSTTNFGKFALRFKDALLNVGFCLLANSFKEIINLPFYFKTVSEWEEIFRSLNLKVSYKKEFHPKFSHHSVTFVVQK